jgi:hypothetical protein
VSAKHPSGADCENHCSYCAADKAQRGDAAMPSVQWPERFTDAQKARARAIVSPQPTPTVTGSVAAWPLVIDYAAHELPFAGMPATALVVADMLARDEYGRNKYQVPLTSDNDRDHLIDWYQEKLDGLAYARAEIESGDKTGIGKRLFRHELTQAIELRIAIGLRDGEIG